jgi:hypothetical protein
MRYDDAGYWPVHIENKQRCALCIEAYSLVKCAKSQKMFYGSPYKAMKTKAFFYFCM